MEKAYKECMETLKGSMTLEKYNQVNGISGIIKSEAEFELLTKLRQLEKIYEMEVEHFRLNATKDNYYSDVLQNKVKKYEDLKLFIADIIKNISL